MATAEFEFGITFHGTPEQAAAVLDIIKRYSDGHNGVYISFPHVVVGDNEFTVGIDKDEAILAALDGEHDKVIFNGTGPYGRFCELNEVDFFRDIAKAVPDAAFEGAIEGFTSYTEERLACELKNGILHIDTFFMANEEVPDAYVEYYTHILPLDDFAEMFGIECEAFDENAYNTFIYDALAGDELALDEFDFEEFFEEISSACDTDEDICLDEEGFEAALEAYRELEIMTYEDFLMGSTDLGDQSHYEYDPVADDYITGDSRAMKPGVVYEINDQIREYLKEKGLPHDDAAIDALSVDDVYGIIAGTYAAGEIAAEASDKETPLEEVEAEFAAVEENTIEAAAEVEEEPTEVAENNAPVEENTTAPAEIDAPVEENTTAPAEIDAPVEENTTAPAENDAPVEENTTAPAEIDAPVEENTTAPAENDAPVEESTTAPAAVQKKKSGKAWILWLVLALVATVGVVGYFFCPFLNEVFNAAFDFVRGLLS